MKHLTLILLSSVAITASATHSSHQNKAPFTGLSLFAQAGGILGNADLKQALTGIIILDLPVEYVNNTSLSQGGAAGTVGLGYTYAFPTGIVLGGVFAAGFNYLPFEGRAQAGTNVGLGQLTGSVHGILKTTLRNDFALLFKPGFAFGNTLAYGLIGPRWGNFDSSVNNELVTSKVSTIPPTLTLPAEADQTAYHVGLAVGIGLSQQLSSHVQAGVEYQYTTYSNGIASFSTNNQALIGSPYERTSYVSHDRVEGMTTNTLMATLAYQF